MPRTRQSLRNLSARSSRLTVAMLTETRNASQSHCARSISRQRTTPSRQGWGPASTICASAARWSDVSVGRLPGALRSTRPAGPSALKRTTQSRTICSPTPPIRAASVREPPSRTAESASSRRTLIHAIWHAPLFGVEYDAGNGVPWAISVVSLSIVICWVYLDTGGSLLMPMLMHASNNTVAVVGRMFDAGISSGCGGSGARSGS